MRRHGALPKCLFLFLVLCAYRQVNGLDLRVASVTSALYSAPDYQCDGVDDNVQIQAALDRIRTAGGGTLYLSDGVFDIKTTVNIYENTDITGQGMDATVLRLSSQAPKFAKAGFMRCYLQNNIGIRSLTLDGNRQNQLTDSTTNYGRFGVYSEACNNTVLEYLRVRDWYGYGLDPHGVGGTATPSQFVTITHNEVHGNGWDGITIDKCEDSNVAFNNVYNNGRHGINVCTGSKRVNVHDNTLTHNGFDYKGGTSQGCGIMVQNNQGYTTVEINVCRNTIVDSLKGAICLTDVSNMEILNNIISQTTTCLRTKDITSIASNNVVVDVNVCDGSKQFYSETPYSGPIPTFIPVLSPKTEYVVVSATSSMVGDFKCDGVNDEQEIIKAILYVAFYGGTVTLSDGVFNLGVNIGLASNVVLRGQGRDQTTIRLINAAPKWKYAGLLRGYDIENIVVKDMTIDGNRQGQVNDSSMNYGRYGFYCEVCRNVVFDNIKCINHWGYGIDPHGTPGEAFYSDGFAIRNSIVEQNGWDGITIDKTLNTVISNNVVQNNGRHGINIVTGSKHVAITNNQVINNGWFYYTGSTGCGIMVQNNDLFGTSDVRIETNTVQLSKNSGVCLNDVDNIQVVSNSITGASSCGKITNSDYIHIESNTCSPTKKMTVSGLYDPTTYTVVDQTNVVFS